MLQAFLPLLRYLKVKIEADSVGFFSDRSIIVTHLVPPVLRRADYGDLGATVARSNARLPAGGRTKAAAYIPSRFRSRWPKSKKALRQWDNVPVLIVKIRAA